MKETEVAVIGAGPAALALASDLDPSRFRVTLYEQNAAAGRKFLVAGDGGLNITHSEPAHKFIRRYTPYGFLEKAFRHFTNDDLREWMTSLGIATYCGTSGRVFPAKTHKPIEVLNVILRDIYTKGVSMRYRCEWTGWDRHGALLFREGQSSFTVRPAVTVFALGGGSWPVTGSNDRWHEKFRERGIKVNPYESSNCAIHVAWPETLSLLEGKPLKNIAIECAGTRIAGEVVITKAGLEGSGIYPLSPMIRKELRECGTATLVMDMKPQVTAEGVLARISEKKRSATASLKALNLSAAQIALIRAYSDKANFSAPNSRAELVKELKIPVCGMGPVSEAISTVGGIDLGDLSDDFELLRMPGSFAIGEMLDYDAPTGGYLLQSCFSVGKYLARVLNNRST